jgi:subtilisin-like proprotein convertase family protein
MQKTITLKDFKVFLLKSFLSMLILGISFQVSLAQKGITKPGDAKPGRAVLSQQANLPQPAVQQTKIGQSGFSTATAPNAVANAGTNTVSDIIVTGKATTEKELQRQNKIRESFKLNPPTSNATSEACVFTGGLVTGDLTLTNGRFTRDGVASSCGTNKVCPGPFGTGPYFYDTYTFTNPTATAQCVTASYKANAGGGDVFGVTYLGSFNPANLCTNYLADGGVSSLSTTSTTVSYNFNVPGNATVVIVLMGAQINTQCPSYTLSVDNLLANCCVDPTVPTITGNLNICSSGGPASTQLTATGSLNSATTWTWYSGSCGGTVVGTGRTITLSPTATTTYYVRGTGGCVTSAPCASVTVNVVAPSSAAVLSQVQIQSGINNLINESFNVATFPTGWAQQNLSSPIGTGAQSLWFQGSTATATIAGAFPANSAPDFRSSSFFAGDPNVPSTISNWMFTPAVTLKNGDVFSFFTRANGAAFPDRMQVRLSTNGNSVNVGTTATSVGDYTTLLVDINPTYSGTGYPTAWTKYTFTISGMPAAGVLGKMAFRHFVEDGGGGANSWMVGVDDVVYSTPTFTDPTSCIGSTANLKVDITGGLAPYTVVYNTVPPAANVTLTNYTSGTSIPVTLAATTTYTLVSVTSAAGCVGTGNTGTPTITVGAATMPQIAVTAAPTGPLCAGNNTLLEAVTGSPITPINITQSSSNTITAGASAACNAGGLHTDNSYWRAYNLSASALPGPLNIDKVTFGIQQANGGAQNVTVRLYNQTGAAFPGGTRTQIATQTYSIPNQAGTIFTANLTTPVTVAPNAIIVVELFTPSGQATGRSFFIGSNAAPETGLSYISAAACGITVPATTASIGFPNMRIILGIGGTTGTGATPLPAGSTVLWSPANGLSNVTTNPVAAAPMATTTYQALVTLANGCQGTVSRMVTIYQLPAVTADPANITTCEGTPVTFTAAGTGEGITYQWQESTSLTGPFTNLTNAAPYSGVTTPTLSISRVTALMNNFRYRCVITGTCTPAAASAAATLKVLGLPVVKVTPDTSCGGLKDINGTLLTAGSGVPPIPGSVTIASGTINLAVPDNTPNGVNTPLTVAGVPSNATVTAISVKLNMSHTYPGDMIFNLRGPSGQILNLYKYAGGSFTGPASGVPTWGWYNASVSTDGTAAFNSVAVAPFIYGAAPIWKPDALNTTVAGTTVQNPAGFVSNANAFSELYTTTVNGPWTLAMADGGPGDIGALASWSIVINYTTPGSGGSSVLNYTWSPATGLFNNAAATIPYVAGTQTATVYAAPASNTVYTITGTDPITGCSNTGTTLVKYTPPAPTVTPAAVVKCLPDLPVKLKSSSSVTSTVSFASGTINVAIPEGSFPNPPATAGVSTIPVAGIPANGAISNISVKLNITHPFVGDVVAVLKAPNGAVFNLDALLNKTNNSGANFLNTVISSTGTTTLDLGAAPFTGTFKADAVGATFIAFGFTLAGGPVGYTPTVTAWNGLYSVPNGNWTLAMYDAGAPDLGNLTNWMLDIEYVVGVPTNPAIWAPTTGLYTNAAGTIQYTGTPIDSIYASPAATTTYTATVTGIGPATTQSFANPAAITINDVAPASPYPSAITVSGLPVSGTTVRSVTLNGFSHTFPSDVDVVLQSPTGQNVILMSDLGGGNAQTGAVYTFSDAAAAAMTTGANPSGTYKPGNNDVTTDNWPAPGPGVLSQASPALASFTGDPNGGWKLFIVDDLGGDVGSISGGYSITFSYPTIGCLSPGKTVTVTVNNPVQIIAQPVNAVVCTDKSTSFRVGVSATTTSPTYQWQVSTQGGNANTFTPITNGGVYSGATTAVLTITAPPVSLSGYRYRCMVSGASPCGKDSTQHMGLTVNPLPVITLDGAPRKILPGVRARLFATVTPAAATYTWLRNGVQVPGNTNSLSVDVDGLGDYTLRVQDINGCVGTSNMVTIADSASGKVFVYPNPTGGQFQVRYYSSINDIKPKGINIFDGRGKRLITQTYPITAPYSRMDVDLSNYSTGVYTVEVVDVNGNRLAIGRVSVIR